MTLIFPGLLIGLCATVLMDLWALLLNRVIGAPLPNWAMVGRWAATVPSGRVFHAAIADVTPVRGELSIGWAFHYAVGAVYGLVFVLFAGGGWLATPTLLPAWIFAVLTIAAGWFLLQPGMGLGWAASKTPRPWKARGLGLAAHTVFGVGLWGAALLT